MQLCFTQGSSIEINKSALVTFINYDESTLCKLELHSSFAFCGITIYHIVLLCYCWKFLESSQLGYLPCALR